MDGKLFPPDLLKLNIKIPRKNQLQSAQSAVPDFNLADGPAHALNAVAWQQLAARPPLYWLTNLGAGRHRGYIHSTPRDRDYGPPIDRRCCLDGRAQRNTSGGTRLRVERRSMARHQLVPLRTPIQS